MENRKVFLNKHTNLLELEEHMYPLVDVDGTVSEDVEAQLAAVEGVLKVRVIR